MNKISYTNIDTLLFNILLMCGALFLAISPLRISTIRRAIVFIGSGCFYIVAARTLIHKEIKSIYFIGISSVLAIMIIGGVATCQGNFIELVYQCLNFTALIFIIVFDGKNVVQDERESVYRFSIIATIILSLGAFMPGAYIFEDGRRTGALTLGMTNPNFTAMMIGAVYNLLVIFFKEKKKIWMLPLMGWLLYLLILTEARSCLIMSLIVTIYALFLSRLKVHRFAILVTVLASIIIVPIYLYLYRSKFSDFQFMGKQFFSGRQSTYQEILNYITTPLQMIFGNLGMVHFQNAHNAPLSVMCSIGITGMITVYLMYIAKLFEVNDGLKSPEMRVAFVCILATFVQSSAEALMLTGHFSGMLFMYIYRQLAMSEENIQ